jgi:hypothetical protein
MKTYYVAIAINGALKAIQCRECEIPGRMEKYTKEILRDYLNNVQIEAVMNCSTETTDTPYFITRNLGQIVVSRRVEEISVGYLYNSKMMREEVFATVYGGEFVGEMPSPAMISKPVTNLRDQFMIELGAEIKRRAPDC